MRHVLARQAAAHSDHLQEALDQQAKDLEMQMEKKHLLDLLDERHRFKQEVAGWLARLRGIEKAITGAVKSLIFQVYEKKRQIFILFSCLICYVSYVFFNSVAAGFLTNVFSQCHFYLITWTLFYVQLKTSLKSFKIKN